MFTFLSEVGKLDFVGLHHSLLTCLLQISLQNACPQRLHKIHCIFLKIKVVFHSASKTGHCNIVFENFVSVFDLLTTLGARVSI